MNRPKISIVTPSLNQAGFVEETLQSVLNQGYENLEYVVVDGGSSDGSVDIIRKYEHRLHRWVSEKDEGHGHAINKGFAHTDGEIMAWINSDDKYTAWSFDVVADVFARFPHVMWIMGINSWWNPDGAMIHAERRQKNIFDFLLGNYAWIQQESVFWRRSLWEKAGGYVDQDYKFMVDGELWTRFFLHADLYTVDCILGGYRAHPGNRARHHAQACAEEMEKAISVMKGKCPGDVLKTCAKLQLASKISETGPCKYLPISRLSRKLVIPDAFRAASYKNITYQNENWIERTMPFSV